MHEKCFGEEINEWLKTCGESEEPCTNAQNCSNQKEDQDVERKRVIVQALQRRDVLDETVPQTLS